MVDDIFKNDDELYPDKWFQTQAVSPDPLHLLLQTHRRPSQLDPLAPSLQDLLAASLLADGGLLQKWPQDSSPLSSYAVMEDTVIIIS